jgi:GxxExxY protein
MEIRDPIMDLCDIVRETSFAVHRYLRSGHFEKIYENSLAHRLRKQAIAFKQQHPIEVYDEDGTPLGQFVTDLFIEQQLVVELKACSALVPEHTAQVLGYLRACRLRHGMLINFGAPRLQIEKLIL